MRQIQIKHKRRLPICEACQKTNVFCADVRLFIKMLVYVNNAPKVKIKFIPNMTNKIVDKKGATY